MKNVAKPGWICLLLVLFFAGSAFAAKPDFSKAKALIQAGKSAEAYTLLEPLEFEQAGNVEYDYLLGTAALNSGMPGKATLVFERVLAVEPRYVGVRADMARAYFDMGDYARAKIEFETILVLQSLPLGIREQAQKYVAAIERGAEVKLTVFTGYVDMGFGHDNNVSSSTRQSPILFTASNYLYFPPANGLPRNDTYAALILGGEVNHKLGEKWSVYGGVDARVRAYTKYADANYEMLDGRTGLSYNSGAHILRIGVIGGRFYVAEISSRDTVGLTGEWRYTMDSSNQLSMTGQQAQYRFVDAAQASENYDQSTIGVGWLYAFAGGKSVLMMNAGAGVERDVNDRTDGGKRFNSLRLTGQSAVTDTVGAFVSLGAMAGNFDKLNSSFLVLRKDELYDLTLGASIQVFKTWSLRPQVVYMKSLSNVAFYEFDKTDVSINLRRDY